MGQGQSETKGFSAAKYECMSLQALLRSQGKPICPGLEHVC